MKKYCTIVFLTVYMVGCCSISTGEYRCSGTNGHKKNCTVKDAQISVAAPDRTVVLTFDDSVRSHLTQVAPLLKKYGFGATFFVTHAWMEDKGNYLDWEDIAELEKMGFEIGNHSWSHIAFATPESVQLLPEELRKVEYALKNVGVSRPVSFSWPGNQFCPESLEILRKGGYSFARRGPQPDAPESSVVGLGALYDPEINDPLLIPSSGLAIPEWTVEDFKTVVDRAVGGKIAVLQFHGAPDFRHPSCSTPIERFRQFITYLSENKFHVIALRDVAPYVSEKAGEHDPIAVQRFIP